MLPTVTRNPNLSVLSKTSQVAHQVGAEFAKDWFTGLSPEKCPGFDPEHKVLRALPLLNLSVATVQDIEAYFENSWTLTELLFQSLKTRDAYVRPPYHQLRHPMLFYYGHPAVLYVNKLRVAGLLDQSVDLYLEKVLETGVDEMSWDDLSKNEMEWPSIREVWAYRKKVRQLVLNVIREHGRKFSDFKNDWRKSPLWSVVMGVEHEKIHFETSSVLIRELPIELVERPKYFAPLAKISQQFSPLKFIAEKGGSVKIGKPINYPTFGWDNEYGSRVVELAPFHYSEHLISNGEFLEFVRSGSYIRDEFWEPEGLAWRKFRNTKRPTFWAASGPEGSHEYSLRTLFEFIELPLGWPAEVNFHEAKAYCNWKKKESQSKEHFRLLTEAEFVKLSRCERDAVLQTQSYAKDAFGHFDENFNFKYSSASAVDHHLTGNVWHWLEDHFNPLEGFEVHSYYDDFSTPCFDGKHHMILGGSFMSCGHEASTYARYHFRPHFYQHSGFRIAYTDGGSKNSSAKLLRDNKDYVHSVRENALQQMADPNWWHSVSQPLDLTAHQRDEVTHTFSLKIRDWMSRFDQLAPQGISHDPLRNHVKAEFKLPYQPMKNLPERSDSLDGLLKLVVDELAPLGQLPGHKGYMAYLGGRGNEIASLAQWLSMNLNPYSSHYMMAPGLVALEEEALGWFKNLFGFSRDVGGHFTSGSSTAILTAIGSVRNSRFHQNDFPSLTIYVTPLTHHCVKKAWSFLGASNETIRTVRTDKDGRMNSMHLNELIESDRKLGFKPLMVVGTAGSTNTGSVDPLDKIAEVCRAQRIWFHVDGAYGAAFMLTEKGRGLLAGIEHADSLNFDLHKSLSFPYGTGGLIYRDKSPFFQNSQKLGSYMPTSSGMDGGFPEDYADVSIELSRDYRGLRIWLPIKYFGIGPFKLNLEEKLQLTDYLIQGIRQLRKIEVKTESDLTVVTFGLKEFTQDAFDSLLSSINLSGQVFVSTCSVGGEKVLRACLLSFKTHKSEVDQLITLLKTWDN